MNDYLVEEIRKIREDILKECNYDTETLKKYFQKVEDEEVKKGRIVISLPKKLPKIKNKVISE